jgi:single-strand DNA-binding protein
MPSLNEVRLLGHLGRTPEMRFTPNGNAVCEFSLATNRKVGDAYEADWHNIVCWGKTAEYANDKLDKGDLVLVAGRIQYRSWDGQDGQKRYRTEVVAERVLFLRHKEGTGEGADKGEGVDDGLPF